MSTPVSPTWVAERNAAFRSDRAACVVGNAVATTDVEKLSLDREILTSIDSSVSDLIPDASITDQKHSGRCWAFAGLNVLRAAVIKELNLESFEFSQSFVYFHDKLEKANTFLTHAVADAQAGADLMDRCVTASFEAPIGDGGYWPELARLVAKYGAVPHYAMPDSFSATSSDAMNSSLATVLRRGDCACVRLWQPERTPSPSIRPSWLTCTGCCPSTWVPRPSALCGSTGTRTRPSTASER